MWEAADLKRREMQQAQAAELEARFDPKTELARLRAYREQDPRYRRAIENFVTAEVTHPDPVEGIPLKEQLGQPGPVQRKIREMLGA